MICPNCKSHIENNIKYCNYCGTKLTNLGQDMQLIQTKVESEEDYLKAYMGPYYQLRGKDHFSIPTLFFGPFHFLYKRMYVIGILLLIVIGIIYFYQKEMGFLFNIILNLFFSFKFQSMYDDFSNNKIDEIKINNADKSPTELLEICRRKGKPLLGFILIMLIIITGIISMIPSLIPSKEETHFEEAQLYELSYHIPDGFKEGNYHNDTYRYYYYQEDRNYCSIYISVNDTTNLEEYIEAYFGEKVELQDASIRDRKWKNIMIYKEEEEDDNFFMTISDHLYHISYKNMNDSSCIQYKEEFLTSLDFRETNQ